MCVGFHHAVDTFMHAVGYYMCTAYLSTYCKILMYEHLFAFLQYMYDSHPSAGKLGELFWLLTSIPCSFNSHKTVCI